MVWGDRKAWAPSPHTGEQTALRAQAGRWLSWCRGGGLQGARAVCPGAVQERVVLEEPAVLEGEGVSSSWGLGAR